MFDKNNANAPYKQKGKLISALSEAAMDTLENMAFMEVEPVNGEIFIARDNDYQWSELLVHGPFQGELRIIMPRSLIRALSETMYGSIGKENEKEILDDAMGEILNTIAGRFMNKLLSKYETFQLGLPEAGKGQCSKITSPSVEKQFKTEDGAFTVMVSGESLLQMG